MKAQRWSRGIVILFLWPRRYMGWVVNATPQPLYPRERPSTYCIGDWVGPRAGLDRCGKSRPPPGLDPQTIQPIASHYTDWAIPAHPLRAQAIWSRGKETLYPYGNLSIKLMLIVYCNNTISTSSFSRNKRSIYWSVIITWWISDSTQ